MEKNLQKVLELIDNQEFDEALTLLMELYNDVKDKNIKEGIMPLFENFTCDEQELRSTYEHNLNLLKQYQFYLGKTPREFDELQIRLFSVNGDLFYLYNQEHDVFMGVYDPKSQYQMRYFFENLDKPLCVDDEDNIYNLTFLNDNVRRSEDFGGDNHIYLRYSSMEPLERLMLVCDLDAVLKDKKFVLLMGKGQWSKYPISFKKQYGIDYLKMKPSFLRIEEINRIFLNQTNHPYAYSGIDFFQGVMNGSQQLLVINAWFFYYQSASDIVKTYTDYIKHPEQIINVQQFLSLANNRINEIKFPGLQIMLDVLPQILEGREQVAVHELFKAVMIAAMFASQKIEGKNYLSRISPAIFFDPHNESMSDYHELLRYFKYPAVEATVREPEVRAMRAFSVLGMGRTLEDFASLLRHAYVYGKGIPYWLLEKGFYVARLEDLKLKSESTLRTICRTLNLPYTDKLLIGKVGLWGVLFTNEKGEQLQGFDRRSVQRDVSDWMTPFDKERLDLYYWHIHRYFHYPCASVQKKVSPEEVRELFSKPFKFEEIYTAQYYAYRNALQNASPEDREKIQAYIDSRLSVDPAEIRSAIQNFAVEDCLNGFAPDLFLPKVMFPEDEMDWPLPQSQRLSIGISSDTQPKR